LDDADGVHILGTFTHQGDHVAEQRLRLRIFAFAVSLLVLAQVFAAHKRNGRPNLHGVAVLCQRKGRREQQAE